ncbi:ChbG/HpnK family deacetylase [Vibrio ishigakensis]|uniref:ChbG/HpnK family deacetylase n=1 Tax=Vibrio ishigakensis TaxID=1481914 RepID=UPI0021C486C3|nr:ChbG/HpnK family deacetylase [Vibrio ishigakensis]
MKKVIINVDDFGVCEEYNKYVKELIDNDKVSSASILVNRNAQSAQDALLFAQQCKKNVSFGLHLDLSDYFQFDALGLWGRDEEHIIEEYREIIEEKRTDIRLDIEQQFKTFANYNVPISHLDGHHNIHLFPEIRDILLPIMLGYNVLKCRFFDDFYLKSENLEQTQNLYQALGVKTPNNLIFGVPTETNKFLIDGVNEVMIHATFGTEQGGTEFDNLMTGQCFNEAELITYYDI